MNYSTYNISLDIHETASQVSLNVKRGDTARRICAVLTEGGKPYKIESLEENAINGCSVVFRAKKPADRNGDRKNVYNDANIINNQIVYDITAENTEVAGVADCEFTVIGADKNVITSPKFTLVIDNTVTLDGEIAEIGSDEMTALSALVAETTNALGTTNSELQTVREVIKDVNAIRNEIKNKLDNNEFVGEQGATFIPKVSATGVISWDNDKGLANPEVVNIRGQQGEPGNTPYIKNGIWWIGDTDTGIRAQGIDGYSPYIGTDGNWMIMGNYNSGVPATGPAPIKGVDYYTEADKEEFRNTLSSELLQFANAIKGTSSGSVIRVEDVSPVKHPVKAKVTPSTAKVIVSGKNLVNDADTHSFTRFWYLPIYDIVSGCIGKRIAVSYEMKLDSLVADTNQMSNYAYQGQGVSINSVHEFVPTSEWQRFSFVTTVVDLGIVNTSYSRGAIAFYDKKGENVYSIRNIQIELGSEATEYEPYEGATYTPNTDGTVEIVSVSPTMTLLTDNANATIECEYNRDTNKVIAELLAGGGTSSRISSVNLLSANWQGTESPYSQVVSINGVTEYSKVDLNPSVQQLAIFHDKDIEFVTENEDGIVTVYCIGQKPSANYEMQVTITEVNSNG